MSGCKGLVIAHNPLSKETNNGKTYASLLKNYEGKNLCQIYVSNLKPDYEICKEYYKINEKDILFNRKNIKQKYNSDNEKKNVASSKLKDEIRYFFRKLSASDNGKVIRNFLWGRKTLLSNDLREWIDEQKPDFVFWGNDYIFRMLSLVNEICDMYSLPLVVNLGDDYFSDRKGNLFYKIYLKHLQKEFKKIVDRAEVIIVCSEKMKNKLYDEFGGNYVVALNSVDDNEKFERKHINKKNIKISYIGNLGLNRWKTICMIASAVEKLENKYNIQLNIFSGEKLSTGVMKKMQSFSCLKYNGSVYGKALFEKKEETDILLLVESFDKKYKNLLETAVSTKVPEYMNSQRAILAVGPKYSAAVDYLRVNDLAEVVSEEDVQKIINAIEKIIQNDLKRNERIEKAQELVKKCHLQSVNANIVSTYIEKALRVKRSLNVPKN